MSKRKKFHATVSVGILPPMEVTLFHDRVKLKKRLAERDHDIELIKECQAQTFSIEQDGKPIHFVLMEADEGELYDQLALLAHEGAHVASRYFESIGEGEPAEEEWAYAIQSACSALFDMHLAWRDGRCEQ